MNILKNKIQLSTTKILAILTLKIFILTISFSVLADFSNSPIFLMYHRFGENSYPTTNTTIKQLEQHIAELSSDHYNVLPMELIIKSIKEGTPLKDRTIGISIDDSYQSIYTTAWPRFQAANLPFTIFVSTAAVNFGSKNHLSWSQIREMKSAGVSIGHHTHSHIHMPSKSNFLNKKDLVLASSFFKKELGKVPKLFAYPYGEISLETIKLIKSMGFSSAFGQHSGVMTGLSDLFQIPRFAVNEKFGNINRLKIILNSLPFSITDQTPREHLVLKINPPAIGFTLNQSMLNKDKLRCFISSEGNTSLERLGVRRVEVRIKNPLPRGRTRMNCTLPGKNGRWHWFGRMFLNLN